MLIHNATVLTFDESQRVLEDAADRNTLVVPAHFGGVHCCRVRRRGDAFAPIFELP